MLTSRSQLLNILRRGYEAPFDRECLGGATGHYAHAHLDIINESLQTQRSSK
jgi:hypothetical protein